MCYGSWGQSRIQLSNWTELNCVCMAIAEFLLGKSHRVQLSATWQLGAQLYKKLPTFPKAVPSSLLSRIYEHSGFSASSQAFVAVNIVTLSILIRA